MNWQTKTKAAGGCSAGVSLHLLSTLYGSTGSDISIAIVGEVEGEVGVGLTNTSNGIEYVGSIDMSVAPQVYGNVVVSVPIIDKQLADKPIFRIKLPAFWEEHWDSGNDWEEEYNSLVKGTYITRYAQRKSPELPTYVGVPAWQFTYSNNWSITKEEINEPTDTIYEVVELTNERGVVIRYAHFNHDDYNVGVGRDSMTCEVAKVSDSNVTGNMVAKVHDLTYGDVSGRYESEMDTYFFAVVPEGYLNLESYTGADEWRINRFSFWDGDWCSFVALSPDGKFTQSEEKEIIEILSSFRELDYSAE